MNTYLGDETSGAHIWEDALVGREIINVTYSGGEVVEITLDDDSELRIDASLGCCAYGEVFTEDVVGGRIMSVSTDGEAENGPAQQSSYEPGPDSIYKIFIMKDGLPGSITVNSYEGSGYYGTGYTLSVQKPKENS